VAAASAPAAAGDCFGVTWWEGEAGARWPSCRAGARTAAAGGRPQGRPWVRRETPHNEPHQYGHDGAEHRHASRPAPSYRWSSWPLGAGSSWSWSSCLT